MYPHPPLFSEILPNLFMGGTDDDDVIHIPARIYNRNNALPFDAIVTMYEFARPAFGGVQEFRYAVPDASIFEIDLERLRDAVEFAHARWKAGDRVLIRCQAGLNRSGLVTALLLIKEGHAPHEAIDLIRMKRSQDALCNMDFAEWIAEDGKTFIAPITTASA
jgi:protein-tyrosine phosphatase